jgi:uncharacterized protein YbdZ (MbtH family)
MKCNEVVITGAIQVGTCSQARERPACMFFPAMNVDTREYAIVKCEMRYSIWPTDQPLPAGYSCAGPVGTRAEMEALLSQQFEETVAASYARNTSFAETNWTP